VSSTADSVCRQHASLRLGFSIWSSREFEMIIGRFECSFFEGFKPLQMLCGRVGAYRKVPC
jgi:hypothetical protein